MKENSKSWWSAFLAGFLADTLDRVPDDVVIQYMHPNSQSGILLPKPISILSATT